MPELWEKQKGESRQAFQAFAKYRDFGSARSYAKVAQELGKSHTLIQRWGSAWYWQARVDAWDEELDRQAREKQIKDLQDMNERHIKGAMAFQKKALEKLLKINLDELSSNDIIRYFEVAAKVERLARGEPTEVTKGQIEHGGKVMQEHDIGPDLEKIAADPQLQSIAIQLFRGIRGVDRGPTAGPVGNNSGQ